MSQEIILYDLPSQAPCRSWSGNVWKTRLALNFKGVPYKTEWIPYVRLQETIKSLGLEPHPPGSWSEYSVPTVRFPDGTYVMDSAAIAKELEYRYPHSSFRLNPKLEEEAHGAMGETSFTATATMSASNFAVKTHIFDAQHIRHYPGATRHGDNDVQRLEAKQYIPLKNQSPQDGDITIIGLHATNFPKELYEPLWDDLLALSDSHGFRMRSIWIADASNQNASGVLNEQTLGDDPSFSDYARDILHMTNVFREHMVPPIVGVGHSIGGAALIRLSCMHPRLFASLVLLDPILGMDTMATGQRLIPMAATKPDLFPSRELAQKGFKKAFKNWDERAFQRWMEFGLRDTPTLLYPEPGKITLRTTKANEAWSYARTQLDDGNEDGTKSRTDWIKYPDANPAGCPFYRPEGLEAMEMLPRIRPDVLFVFPQYIAASPESHEQNVARTGIAIGGSGGVKEGEVAKAILKNAGHLCPFEVPTACAQAIAEWLGPDLKAWKDRVVYEREHRDDKSINGIRLSERFIREARQFSKTGSSGKNGKL